MYQASLFSLALVAMFLGYKWLTSRRVRHQALRREVIISRSSKVKLKTPKHHPSLAKKIISKSDFHCVEVISRKTSCKDAKALKGKHFLIAEAPQLPLPSCKQELCTCGLKEYDDRRDESSRRSDFGLRHELFGSGEGDIEKRAKKKRGRRRGD